MAVPEFDPDFNIEVLARTVKMTRKDPTAVYWSILSFKNKLELLKRDAAELDELLTGWPVFNFLYQLSIGKMARQEIKKAEAGLETAIKDFEATVGYKFRP